MSLTTSGLESQCVVNRLFAREADVAEQIKNELQPGRKLKREVEYWLREVGKLKDEKQEIEKKAKGGAFSSPIDDLKEEVTKFTEKCKDHMQQNLPAELTLCDCGLRDDDLEDMRSRAEQLLERAADVEEQVTNELQPGRKLKRQVESWLRDVKKIKDKKQVIEDQINGGVFSSHNDLKKQVENVTSKCIELVQQNLPAELTLCDHADCNLALVTTFMKGQHVVDRHSDCGLGNDLEDMRRKADQLFARAAEVDKNVKNEELQSGRKLKSEVEYWLGEVGKMKVKKQDIEEKVNGGASSSHNDLKEQVVKFTDKCMDLLQQNLPAELTLCDRAVYNLPLPTETMKGKLFEENLAQVLSWLDGDGATSIGVYGMGGVGKTTLVKHVQNQLCQKFNNGKCSGYVYWVTVSHGITVSSLQSKIANQMGLADRLKGKDEDNSAATLYKELKGLRNCVLILDDMWGTFSSLKEIGIPIGEDGFKLLVTARSKDVCRQLGLKATIFVKCLTDDESWDLFREKLGNSVILTQEVKDIQRKVAKECKGLPIAIITIASSMRRVKSIEEWRNVLMEMQQLTRQQEVLEEKILPSLQLSYDRLGNSQLKDCFLYSAFYPEDEDIEVEELIACWTREGLLEGIENREERRDEGHSIVNRLVNACLLEYNDYKYPREILYRVKMHDLVRKMAVKVCRGKHFLIRAGEGRTDILPEEEWTMDLCKVSLMGNDIKSISPVEPPNCPNLKTLLLGSNNNLKSISSKFFSHLTSLRVLDLSWSKIESLPESISDLVHLTALLLRECEDLTDLPSLSKLQKLTELNLFLCQRLKNWPDGMGSLRNLEVLDCIGSGVQVGLSAGSDLQELQLEHSGGGGGGKAKPLDLKMLEHLEELSANWKSNTDFNAYVTSERYLRLHQYHFIVGTDYPEEIMKDDREEILDCYNSVICCECRLDGEKPRIPFDVEFLVFYKCVIGEESSLMLRELPQSVVALKEIRIYSCKGPEYVLCSASSAISGLLPVEMLRKLEKLRLKELDGFKGLVKAGVLPPPDALSNLRELEIRSCNDLKWLFTPTMACNLQNLSKLTICNCNALEEVIGGSDNDVVGQARYLPKLENLSLKDLPNLKRICPVGNVGCGSIKRKVKGCPKLETRDEEEETETDEEEEDDEETDELPEQVMKLQRSTVTAAGTSNEAPVAPMEIASCSSADNPTSSDKADSMTSLEMEEQRQDSGKSTRCTHLI